MAIWPAALPAPALDTFTESPPNNKIRSTNDKGPPKERRRTTANVRPIAFTLKLTSEQVDILDEFFVETLYSGVLAFDMEHPRTGQIVSCKFADEPTYAESSGIIYNCAISLEIQP